MRSGYTFLAMASVFLFSGCEKGTAVDYSFNIPEYRFEGGTLHAQLRGSNVVTGDNLSNITGSPYELWIWLDLDNFEGDQSCSLRLSSLVFRSSESQNLIPTPQLLETNFKLESEGNFRAFFILEGFDLNYSPHDLELAYELIGACGISTVRSNAKLVFETMYQERKITIWSVLMGI